MVSNVASHVCLLRFSLGIYYNRKSTVLFIVLVQRAMGKLVCKSIYCLLFVPRSNKKKTKLSVAFSVSKKDNVF